MHLSPRELDKLQLHQVGVLAQKRLARGLRLNHPEAVALIATQVLEFIRDGRRVAELMDLGKQLLGRRQVLPGVPELVAEVQVEGTFPDGTKLVTVHHPICREDGDLALALYGSFLPVPDLSRFSGDSAEDIPGQVAVAVGEVELNAGRPVRRLTVTNLADRPIQVGSHYHLIEVNPYLRLDRAAAYGMRLDLPAGTAVRFEPGETKTVAVVPIAGDQVIRGGNALADGPVSDAGRVSAVERAIARGFAHVSENSP
ncbi:urease subunit gamma/beta [Planctomycetota bacterium]|nr:urease subunit gamma/beta [Planctomycetota bacterium]